MNTEESRRWEIFVDEEDAGTRIDKYISQKNEELSRAYIQKLIKEGQIHADGNAVKANFKVTQGSLIQLELPIPRALEVIPEEIPLDIIYEDRDIILINKGKNMVVHPSPGHISGTLVNGLLYHCREDLSGINGILRPGIVHRIDKNTTGVLVICKNDKAHESLAGQLREHSITRRYYAIAHFHFKESSGTIHAPIGRHPIDRKKMAVNYKNGKEAVTHYKVIESLKRNLDYIECHLETGRTHQIRVHMASIHHPLLGDDVYSSEKSPFFTQGQALHAGVLGFCHPTTGKYMEFQAPLPNYFEEILQQLR